MTQNLEAPKLTLKDRNPVLFLLWSWGFWGKMVIRNRYYR